jgi:hypothetical protein
VSAPSHATIDVTSAAACEAANASWLEGPATKVSNV